MLLLRVWVKPSYVVVGPQPRGSAVEHGGNLITVFSAAKYQGHRNDGAVLNFKRSGCSSNQRDREEDALKLVNNRLVKTRVTAYSYPCGRT